MKPSEILKQAARRVELLQTTCGCDSIRMVVNGSLAVGSAIPPESVMQFFRLVGPRNASAGKTWWGRWRGGWYSCTPADRDARIIGLCLAAAIAESEGQ